jgi:hypothetical protein
LAGRSLCRGLLRLLTHSLAVPVIKHRIPPSNAEGIMTATCSFVSRLHNTTYIPRLRLNIISPLYFCVTSGSFPRNFLVRILPLRVRPIDCKPTDFIFLIILRDINNVP